MVKGQRSSRQALKKLRAAAKAKGYTVEKITKGDGKSLGKGSHVVWGIYDEDGKKLASSMFPGHPGDMGKTTAESIEEAFEEDLGKGWMD